MKVALGLGFLLALFALGVVLDRRIGRELEAEHARANADVDMALFGPSRPPGTEGGWSWVLLGRPSGREALRPTAAPTPSAAAIAAAPGPKAPGTRAPARAPAPSAGALAPVAASGSGAALEPARGVRRTVAKGETMFGIVRTHYGHATTELVSWVARQNGLGDPGQLRSGQTIWLPTPPGQTAGR